MAQGEYMATIDIIIPAYNAEDTIMECIGSVLQQSYEDWEVIIIDDYCTDRTIDSVKMFQDDRITILKNRYDKGICGALNTGFEYCRTTRSDLVVRHDADDIMLSHRLEYQKKFFDAHPEVDIAGSQIIACDIHDDPREKGVVHTAIQGQANIATAMLFFNAIAHPTVMMRKHVVQDIWYDPTMVGCEDFDLWTRLMGTYTFTNMGFPTIVYRTHENSNTAQHRFSKEYRDSITKIFQRLLVDEYRLPCNVRAWVNFFLARQRNEYTAVTYQHLVDNYAMLNLNPVMLYELYAIPYRNTAVKDVI